jgi:hypothetical protein
MFNVLSDATRIIVHDNDVPDPKNTLYLQSLVCAVQQVDPSHSCNVSRM